MDYKFEPLLDLSSDYQIQLKIHKQLSEEVNLGLKNVLIKGCDASEKELLSIETLESRYNESAEKLNNTFEDQYKELVVSKTYFYGCPYNIYEKAYELRLRSFLSNFPDAEELDFLDFELSKGVFRIGYEVFGEVEDMIRITLKKRLKFLKFRANELGYEIVVKKDDKYSVKRIKDKKIKVKEVKVPLLDLSNSKGTEKIVMLQKLGIIDFLKEKQPFIQSTNKLAEVLSGITGEKAETIQSYINPMVSPGTSQKNNPMKKEKLVSKVNQNLINIGYVLSE